MEKSLNEQLQQQAREIRSLKLWLAVLAGLCVLSMFGRTPLPAVADDDASRRVKFEEIDVQRINIVEKDGGLRMVLANKARFPGNIIGGKEQGNQGTRNPGILFFNDEHDECGGLVISGRTEDGKARASGSILFDQYGQDQTLGLIYSEYNGRRSAGLLVWDRPETPLADYMDEIKAAAALPDEPGRKQAFAKISQRYPVATRVYVGKSSDRESVVMLSDAKNRTRLMLRVTADGKASMEFLDEKGKVEYRFPPTQKQK